MKRAGLDEQFAWHTLRHSYGTALAAQGVPMRTLQEWMGHKDIQTTQRYADYCPNPGERDVVEAAFARQGITSGITLPATRTELSATGSNKHGAAHPTTTPPTGFESHPRSCLRANEYGLAGPPVYQSVYQVTIPPVLALELREKVVPQVAQALGFVPGYWTLRGSSGVSMIVFESEDAATAASERIPSVALDTVTLEDVEVREAVAHA